MTTADDFGSNPEDTYTEEHAKIGRKVGDGFEYGNKYQTSDTKKKIGLKISSTLLLLMKGDSIDLASLLKEMVGLTISVVIITLCSAYVEAYITTKFLL